MAEALTAEGRGGPGRPAGGPLLGRGRELAELAAALEDAMHERPRLKLLVGEPGVGKTRLAEEVAGQASAAGAVVAWSSGWGPAAPAYWPWIQVVRTLAKHGDAEAVAEDVRAAGPRLLRLAPELGAAAAVPEAPDDEDDELARFGLFDALLGFLRARSRRAPLVLVFDDLQAVDEDSLLALDFVARGLQDAGVLVIGALHEHVADRSEEAQATLVNLARAGDRVLLRGLEAADVASLVEHAGGGPAAAGLAQALHAATEGNPFFAHEIVRLLLAEGRLTTGTQDLPLPEGVRETIRRRLAPLPAAQLRALALAAVLGRSFRAGTLVRAAGMERPEVLDALDQAVALGLVAEDPGVLGRYRFVHGLIRDTLVADLSIGDRMAAHQAAAEALEAAYGTTLDEHLPEVAHHFLMAAPRGDARKALDYAARAGEQALAGLAYEQAADLFERALQALELTAPDGRRRAGLLLGLGEAQTRAGRPPARDTYQAAAAAAREAGAPGLLARAAIGFGPFGLAPGYVDEAHVALLEEALERHGPGDDPLRVRLLGALACAVYWAGPASAARRAQLAGEAVDMAHRLGDRRTLALALALGQLATSGPDTTERGLEWIGTLIDAVGEGPESAMTLAARSRHVDLLLETGDHAGAAIAVETLARLADEARDRRAATYVPLHRARRAAMDGRFAEAEQLTTAAAWEGERIGADTLALLAASQTIVMGWQRNGLAGAAERVRPFADRLPAMPAYRAALAAALAAEGRTAEARGELGRLSADGFAAVPRDNLWLLAMALLSEACAALGDAPAAEALHTLLAPFAGRHIVSPAATYAGPVELWLGLLAATAGREDEALAHLEGAARRAAEGGARASVARIEVERAALLAGRDPAGARALLEAAEPAAREIGMDALLARIAALGAGEPARPAADAPAPAQPAAPAAAPTDAGVLRREGDVWTLALGARLVRLKDGRGVRLLGLLLEQPGTEVHCLDLIAALDGRPRGAAAAATAAAGIEAAPDGQRSVGPALDAEAKAAYRARIAELRETIEEAEAFNDPERASRAREELELIAEELRGALGLGGRDRPTGSHAERARVNVTRAVRTTLKRVAEYDAALGRELETTVRTGTFCAYQPDPRRPVRWTVDRG